MLLTNQRTDHTHARLLGEQAGDNHQKPPSGGSPWYHTLVADAVENDAVHQAANCGARSAEARGLAVLRRARRVELVRLMRAANDAAFAAAQVCFGVARVPLQAALC